MFNKGLLFGFCVIVFCLLPLRVEAKGKTIYASSIKRWTPSSLEQLVNTCTEGSTIVFDADYDYTIDRCIKPRVSINIKGNGKTLRTINKYNYVISLFEVADVESFKIDNLVLDGSFDTSNPNPTIPKEFFITIKNVRNVCFTRCTFQNIRTDYPNWKLGDEPYTIWVENYDKFVFTDNVVKNCYCPEFIKAVLPIENKDPNKVAVILRNKMQFVSTSSAVEVRFGRFRINDNEFGFTQGSTINTFGFKSEIKGNYFHGSHNSSAIDLSEQFEFGYVSKKVIVKDNYCEYAHDGFLMADYVSDITIKNNVYRADIVNKEDYDRYERVWFPVEMQNDRALRLDHEISNISIVSNQFVGANSLLVLDTYGRKSSIKIEKNLIENVSNPIRSTLSFSQVDGMIIKNNTFLNTGRTISYLNEPQFIVINPTESEQTKNRYIKNVVIENNSFSFTDKRNKHAFIFIQTLYDRNRQNTLSSFESIKIVGNKSDFKGNILLITDDNSGSAAMIKRNRFCSGEIWDDEKAYIR